jgi:hypothetical protein
MPTPAIKISATRYDDDGKVCRLVTRDGQPIGRVYKTRARIYGRDTRWSAAYRFDGTGTPLPDPIVVWRLKDLPERILARLAPRVGADPNAPESRS